MFDVPYPATVSGTVLLAVKAAPPAAIAAITTIAPMILLVLRFI